MQAVRTIPTLSGARAAIDACRSALRAGSSSFFAASMLLPPRVRRAAWPLYAFCRLADDAVDDGGDMSAAVRSLQARLDVLRRGECPDHPVDMAFGAVASHFRIPLELPSALIEGFDWDARGRRYEDLPQLLDYAARVAGSVGAMMALVMGVRSPAALARACDLGVAMQLTNIARDVGEDARAGRLYLPLQWLREEGIDPDAWMRQPEFTPALGRVVQRLLDEADALYSRSVAGVLALPVDCRPGIQAARLVYGAIGREVVAAGRDSVSRRAFVPRRRKLALLGLAAIQIYPRRTGADAAVLPANEFLVESVARADAVVRRLPRDEGNAAWVVDLFGRLAQEERLAVSQPVWR